MLKYTKMPRNISEYSLMRGVTDFSNLRQFDMYESGYGFINVVATPNFMNELAKKDPVIKELQDGFVHILEGEFRGIDGVPDLTSESGTVTNGVNELQVINNVTEDTSIEISMTYYERSGSLLTKYADTYLRAIKDPNSKAKTYKGLIKDKVITDPGPHHEVFTFLYYVTDNTCRKIEKAYLFTNAQLTTAAHSTLYNSSRDTIQFQEIQLAFRCFPISGDTVNMYANRLLEYQLTTEKSAKKLILDSDTFAYDIYSRTLDKDTASYTREAFKEISPNVIENKYAAK
jgi:hypothetical protein